MEDRRVDELIEKFEKYMHTIDNNQQASIDFLKGAGILDDNGELDEPYRQECTPQEQA